MLVVQAHHRCLSESSKFALSGITGTVVEEVINFSCSLGADAGNLGEIRGRGALDRLERPEMLQQRPLAARPDAGDFLQAGFADVLSAACAVRPDGEAVRLVAHALDEVE